MMTSLLLELAAALSLITLAGAVLLRGYNARLDRLAARRRAVRESRTQSIKGRFARSRPGLGQLVGNFGTRIIHSGLLSEKTVKGLRATLVDAGLRPDSALGLFVGCKLLLLVGLPVLAWLAATRGDIDTLYRNLATAAAAVLGLLLPDLIIKQMRTRHRKRVERGLPDALDMLIICTEAGMAIESSILRVSQELRFAHAATADELAMTSNELQMTADPQAAFTNMGDRTALDSLRRLGVTIVQTIQYGSPLSHALRVLATELRTEMITRYEERAARLPVLLTLPMILFILPALFLVIGGPAVIKVFAVQNP
jgi:tight adherence protein C